MYIEKATGFAHNSMGEQVLLGYSLFTYFRFAYFRPKSGVLPTRKKSALCNVLNINEVLNIQYNNNTTLPQYIDEHDLLHQ